MRRKVNIAVVGATGAVGREILGCLSRLDFPLQSIRLMASARSKGKLIETAWGEIAVEDLEEASFDGLDIVFFSAGKSVSLAHVHRAVDSGAYVIDNTSAYRMDSSIPLVVPEINASLIPSWPCIIANPNCSTIQMVLALNAIHEAAGLESVRVATYQSCSGAGQKGIDALVQETHLALSGQRTDSSTVHARGIAFDVVPQIGAFQEDGYCEEEQKMMAETRKILNLPNLRISATTVRVPVMRGHSEVVSVVTEKKLSQSDAKSILSQAPGLILTDGIDMTKYPTATQAEGEMVTFVGRVREDFAHPKGLVFWVVSDNLLKGAALNAVEIAQRILAL